MAYDKERLRNNEDFNKDLIEWWGEPKQIILPEIDVEALVSLRFRTSLSNIESMINKKHNQTPT